MRTVSVVFTITLALQAIKALPRSYPWPDNVLQHKGYINLTSPGGVHLFYWFFESRSNPSTDPLVIWLTGGPGCSSELGLLLEDGAFVINGTSTPTYNEYGWNTAANVIYIDQPGGTGFSYVDRPNEYVHSELQIAIDLWNMMLAFYELYPKYNHLDLYIVGESYAGHYVPAFGRAILASNSIYAANLKGIAIGNGWTDPIEQYPQYAPFALNAGIIDQETVTEAAKLYPQCKELILTRQDEKAYAQCEKIPSLILKAAEKKLGRSINEYNIKLDCPVPGCFDMSNLTSFLNRSDVHDDLGVGNHTWQMCNDVVANHLINDEVLNFKNAVSMILAAKKRVLIYSGKLDFICNYFGARAWIKSMKWSGQNEFNNAQYENWIVDNAVAGQVKSYEELTLLEVENAGHQVPMFVPKQALDLVNRFISNKPFA